MGKQLPCCKDRTGGHGYTRKKGWPVYIFTRWLHLIVATEILLTIVTQLPGCMLPANSACKSFFSCIFGATNLPSYLSSLFNNLARY